MRNYPCRLHPAPVLCILLPALHFKLSASCFMHSASSSPLMYQTLRFLLYALGFQLSTHASSSPLLASCFRLPASCALSLYSLLSTHCFCALCSLLSALSFPLSAFRSLPFNRHPPKNGLPGSCIGGGQSRSSSTHRKNACGVRPHVAPPRYLSATSLPSLHPG